MLQLLPGDCLAGRFLNLRFLLATALGLLVQGWRYYGGGPFGARRRDYLEAFALGVGIDAAVSGLAELLTAAGMG